MSYHERKDDGFTEERFTEGNLDNGGALNKQETQCDASECRQACLSQRVLRVSRNEFLDASTHLY